MKRLFSVPGRLTALVALASFGVWETRLSIVASFLCLVTFLSLPPLQGRARLGARLALGLAALLSTVGFFFFVLKEAIPGVIAGGQAAAEKHAVAFLRTIVAAEDYMRRSAHIDPDGDGIGSSASLGELSGRRPLRNGARLQQTPLDAPDGQWIPSQGFIANGAYLYRVCLPTAEGFADSVAGNAASDPSDRVDDERAEREYLVYAWPKTFSAGSPTELYVSDAYERIEQLDQAVGRDAPVAEEFERYYGESAPPPCDLRSSSTRWQPWKDKTPRSSLPGANPK